MSYVATERTREQSGQPIFDNRKIGYTEVLDPVTKTWKPGVNIYLTPKSPYPLGYENVCVDETHPGPPFKTGGGLNIRHVGTGDYLTDTYVLKKGNTRYTTQFYASPLSIYGSVHDPYSPYTWLSTAELSTYGSVGWNKYRPAKPKVQLGVFLAELRDFKRLFATRISQLSSLRGISNLWLAYQFGWLPILNDLRKCYTTYRDCAKIMKRLLDYNGKYERRGGPVASGQDSQTWNSVAYLSPVLSTAFYYPKTNVTYAPVEVTREYKVWFEGALMYLIPNLGDKYTQANVYRKLFGLYVSPAVVWELIPWSWCVDWFTNLGNCLENLDSVADVSHAAYAYVMRTQKVSYQARIRQDFSTDNGTVTVPLSYGREWTKKERIEASPFSPGLTDELLTLRQLTILGALGIQRFRW